ncbi:MAG: MazG family protein [Simkaniaceae bacterium]|nr:MazG family protein [Simkaniaceae bacterium]
MKEFDQLMEVAIKLNGEGGCPWDIKQTFESLRPYVIEEAHEILEAIDEKSIEGLEEELGDLFYIVIFFCMVAKRQKDFTVASMITKVVEKMIRRHPHVFGDTKVENMEEIMENWDTIKNSEKKERKSALDGIPKTLEGLFRAQKIIGVMRRKKFELPYEVKQQNEEEMGEKLLSLVHDAEAQGIDLEAALRKTLGKHEKAFCEWEY